MNATPDLRLDDRGPIPVAHLGGDVDVSAAAGLRERLLRAVDNQDTGLVIDLSEARYMDSAGINILFELAEGLRTRQLGLAVVVPEGGLIERVLALVDLGSVVDVQRDVDAAIEAIRARA
jgi:stage II sporulation protein AA (anti-sigma F factor antagonist)